MSDFLIKERDTNTAASDFPVTTKTANYTVVADDIGKEFEFSNGSALTASLTASSTLGNGFEVIIRNAGAGTLTIDPSGSETIDGQSTVSLSQDQWRWIRTDGSNWKSLAQNDLGGTVTSVGTGTGLTGGPVTSSGTISIANGGVDTTQLADDAVTLAKMASGTAGNLLSYDGSGNPAAVGTGTSGQALLSNGAGNVPSFQNITNGTVTSIATGTGLTGGPITSTGTVSIANGGVDTTQLADDAVTLEKMASGTAGNLITYNSSGDPTDVATGTAGQVLTSNGAGAAPTFQAAPSSVICHAETSTNDLSIATQGSGGTNFGSTFTLDLAENDILSFDFAGRLEGTRNAQLAIGLNISSTTYWFGQYDHDGATVQITFLGLPFVSGTHHIATNGLGGSTAGIPQSMIVGAAGIPTGSQTVQIVFGYSVAGSGVSLKGSVKKTYVLIEQVKSN